MGKLDGVNVIVVDDEFCVAGPTKTVLERAGATVQVFTTATVAIATSSTWINLPQVVMIMDRDLGVENGWLMITQMKQLCPSLRVIAASGLGTLEEARAQEADAFLAKPVYPDQLITKILELVK
jgi:CheY-like chemotaxis protein